MGFTDRVSIIVNTDSYKPSHWLQYPPGMTDMVSYFESRGNGPTVFFGLQYLLREYLAKPFTQNDIEYAAAFLTKHGLPFNRMGWQHILQHHGGKLPVRIYAVPEGSVIPSSNILLRVESTDPAVPWVVSYVETALVRLWYPCTVATRSWRLRRIILDALRKSSDTPEAEIDFKLHDFGGRGVSSLESAGIGGAAHLVNFKGSDTIPGVILANEYYDCEMAGFSIPAAEHSTITSWGQHAEGAAYGNMLNQFAKPGAILAVVSDSYDLWKAIDQIWGRSLREQVIESGAVIVIRPDSGNPPAVVLRALQELEKAFGSKMNSKGYRVLNNVRVIQGDGITEESIPEILKTFMDYGFSATNVAFGMGGGLLQQLDRDTHQFAYKTCFAKIDGRYVKIAKNPVDAPEKKSKSGYLDLTFDGTDYHTFESPTPFRPFAGIHALNGSCLELVYDTGSIERSETLDEIRKRASDRANALYPSAKSEAVTTNA
jgi:nicotinamide phosphoribosyltransferase